MAYQIIGQLYKIGQTENIATRTGNTLQRRPVVLMQRRYDQTTGEEYEPNYPELEFSGMRVADLDRYQPGQMVNIRFDVTGIRYTDKNTGEERYMTRLRAFSIAPYVRPAQTAAPQPAAPAPQPAQQQPQPAPMAAPAPQPYAAPVQQPQQPAPAPYPYPEYSQNIPF